ncbi:DUF3888 domain-containing protein [Bacillus sp. REN16]|uniref:DUF3888 domain-containing protein n=1 Tax=Bacillus sp. REN16 TaxID=2887296 RepID=UPI001E2AD67D|nr:DUF3888 domain-containing protein [Bacillus sp. REN16]MCC3359271.1 DUF3888 domain-containing protein [Bacillus sp. REN16]
MKKSVLGSLVIVLLCIFPSSSFAESQEELLNDTFLITLSPHITNAVTGHYGELRLYTDEKVISITRSKEGGNDFDVIVTITPFVGAHNPIGMDTLTMNITPAGVIVTNYKHEKYQEKR